MKVEERKTVNIKIGEFNLQLHAHDDSGFVTWIILSNLPCDEHIVEIIKNGKDIISLRIFIGYIQNGTTQIPQHLIFRCGMTHLNYSLRNFGKFFNLQKIIRN